MRLMAARLTLPVLVLLSLSLLLVGRIQPAAVEKLRVVAISAVTPVMEVASQPFIALSESFAGMSTLGTLKTENIRLKEENAKLRQWYEGALKLQAENKSLRDLLNVKADAGLAYVTTRVVADPGGVFARSVLIPAGTNDRVGKGAAVLSGQGLAGRVTESGPRAARVLLVTDLNSRIPVVVQNTRHRAILAGRNEERMLLERLPADSGVSVGARIVTSGDGGILPPDLPVGVISEVSEQGIFVTPLADLERMSWVQVIEAAGMPPAFLTGNLSE